MIVSGSEIATLNECEMKYYYQFVLGLWPKENTDAVALGIAGHKNCQQFFEAIAAGDTKEEALHKIIPVAMNEQAFKVAALATKLCEEWNVDSGHPILVEEQRVFPLEGRVKIGITPDCVWQYDSGKIDLIDFKFTGRSWSQEAAELHYQLPTYKGHLKNNTEINPDTLKYIYLNTRNQKEDKYRVHRFTITDEEADETIRDQVKTLDRLIEFRESPVAWSRQNAKRANKIFVCDYCPFKFPCRLGRKGKEKEEQKALDVMFTENTYGYGEDFDDI